MYIKKKEGNFYKKTKSIVNMNRTMTGLMEKWTLQYSCLKIPTDRGASRLPFMGSESDAAEQLSRQIPWRGRKALCCLVAQWSLTLCDPMDCSPQGSSLHGVFQARILECVAISSSKASSWLRDWTLVSSVFCVASGFFTTEPPGKGLLLLDCFS